MVRYQQLECDPVTQILFNNRITTLKGFREVFENSNFLALDTEHVAITSKGDRVLHQVGLAFTKTLKSRHPPCPARSLGMIRPKRRLRHFFEDNEMEGLTLKINTRTELGDQVLRVGGFKGMPIRRPHRFGEEKTVDIEDLEASVVDFLQDLPKDKKLVLIGFGMGAEWTYLSTNFPAAIPFFSAWIDLGDIVTDITSSSLAYLPNLLFLIQTFGYWWKDVKPGRGCHSDGNADNAGDDVVKTLALAHALLDERNHKTLLFEHACFRTASSGRNRRTTPDQNFLEYQACAAILRLPPVRWGFATFRSQEELDYFISCVDGMVLYTGETLSAERYIHVNPKTPEDEKLKEEKRMLRRIKREADDEEVVELEDLFS
ncbi:hypothetical protein RAB80_011347 [Fusarium oxysporum f. sp. vasinfectum]|nr:hypothetical protein RAB80_011347 [Fusarium oxysporum f. sp. vasinfectum]